MVMTEEEFSLDISGTGVMKHMTFNMILEWESKEGTDGAPILETGTRIVTGSPEHKLAMPEGPKIVLKDGIVEWCQKTLENNVYGRCTGFSDEVGNHGPELIFGSEADRACFVLKWL